MSVRENLKRHHAQPSVYWRPSPSKRLKPTIAQHVEARSTSISSSSGLPTASHHAPMYYPQRSTNRATTVGGPNAEQWFNESNRNVSRTANSTFPDGKLLYLRRLFLQQSLMCLDDPPFYLKHNATSFPDSACTTRSGQSSHGRIPLGQRGLPGGPTSSQMQSSKSNSEDFRDVIDDLTVRNKKLRKRLRKYETLHCSHLQEEKLFEVRFHGLPAHKKRELDDFLRSFAVSIEDSPEIFPLASSRQQSSSLPDPLPLSFSKETSSSITSNSKPVDSAYASMSNSGQTQNFNLQINDKGSLKEPVPTAQSKQQKVKSYLDDMPRRLIPKRSLGMSELSKRKLVVRRLEGLFTGKGAASSEHGQPQQQEEVSLSAAKADRSALEARGRRVRMEGIREARIFTVDADALAEHMSDASLTPRDGTNDGDEPTFRDAHASLDGTPDQRPTRPLDLDLYRAQVPADNIQYLRHLGLASPRSKTDPYTNTANGWVYLNLLMNMAQLHAFNVTPEFIRKSVMDLSTRLELSPDGRKIKWKGGVEGSTLSSDSSGSGDDTDMLLEEGHRGSQRHRLEESKSNRPGHDPITKLITAAQYPNDKSSVNFGGSTKLRPIFLQQVNDASRLFYKPMFYHGTSSEEEDDYSRANGSISGSVDNDIDAERAANSQPSNPRRSTRDTKGESGPIIFYNKARFCTDLSGDVRAGSSNKTVYSLFSPEPVGSVGPKLQYRTESPEAPAIKGHTPSEQMDLDAESQTETESLLVFEGTDSQHDDSSHAVPRDMEASGLGGVQPMDHFSIDVRVQRIRINEPSLPETSAHMTSQNQTNRLLRGIRPLLDPPKRPLIRNKIISIDTKQLPPSSLPPPSYIYPQPSLSESTEYSYESEALSASLSGKRALPSSATDDDGQSAQPLSSLSSPGGSKEASSCISSPALGSDDSSIDLLAHARELDPETIAAREMEFDRNAGQQLSEELAGSSTAAARSGSGCPSEDCTTNEEESRLSPENLSKDKKGIDDFSASLRQSIVERDGNDQDNSSVDVMFTSSGMEESD